MSKKPNIKLRRLEGITDKSMRELPEAFQGTIDQCNEYAIERGFIFKKDDSLFNGYFVHPQTGECLIPTL